MKVWLEFLLFCQLYFCKQKAGGLGAAKPPEALGLLVNKLYTLGLFEPMTA